MVQLEYKAAAEWLPRNSGMCVLSQPWCHSEPPSHPSLPGEGHCAFHHLPILALLAPGTPTALVSRDAEVQEMSEACWPPGMVCSLTPSIFFIFNWSIIPFTMLC